MPRLTGDFEEKTDSFYLQSTFTRHQMNFILAKKFDRTVRSHGTVQYSELVYTGLASQIKVSLLLVVLQISVSIMYSASNHAARLHAAPVKFSIVPVKSKLDFGVQIFERLSARLISFCMVCVVECERNT